MAKSASRPSATTRRSTGQASLAARLLRGVQVSAGLSSPKPHGRLKALHQVTGLSRTGEMVTSLQFLRVAVETMAEICGNADRHCENAIHSADNEERDLHQRRLEERVRDLIAAGAKATLPGYPPLTRGAWMVTVPLPDMDPVTARIPGIRAVGPLGALLEDAGLSGRQRLDQIQKGLSETRVQIRDSRISVLGLLETISGTLGEDIAA